VELKQNNPKVVSKAVKVLENLPNTVVEFDYSGKNPVHFSGDLKTVKGLVNRWLKEQSLDFSDLGGKRVDK